MRGLIVVTLSLTSSLAVAQSSLEKQCRTIVDEFDSQVVRNNKYEEKIKETDQLINKHKADFNQRLAEKQIEYEQRVLYAIKNTEEIGAYLEAAAKYPALK